jgi:IclR family acetate operon transcriptional repressor
MQCHEETDVEKATHSVLTALRVIEQVSFDQPVGVSELARSLGLPKSSAHRALSSLSSAGWLQQDSAGRWVLSLRCAAIGRRVCGADALRMLARPVMEALTRTTRENVRLWLAEGETLTVIDSVDGDHAVRPVDPMPGVAVPLHATAVGKAVLAYWPDDVLDRFLREPLPAFTSSTITSVARLREQILHVRQRGYSEVREEAQADIGGVAAPFAVPGDHLGAIAITFPHHRITDATISEFGALVAEAARSIEQSAQGAPSDDSD